MFYFLGDDPQVVKVSLKLPWGKQIIRKFYKSNLVRNVYAFANNVCLEKEKEDQSAGDISVKSFDLFTAYPSMSLHNQLNVSLEDAKVAGSQVILRWI